LEACYDRKLSVGIIAGFLSFKSASVPKHSHLSDHGMWQHKQLVHFTLSFMPVPSTATNTFDPMSQADSTLAVMPFFS